MDSLPGQQGHEASGRAGPGRPAAEVVKAFEQAVNAGDADRVVALALPDVEVGGPRGRGHGIELLREWVERAGIHLRTRRVFARGGTIVAEQEATWGTAETAGGGAGAQAEVHVVATEFDVHDGRIAAVVRHDDLAAALDAAGLREADEVARD